MLLGDNFEQREWAQEKNNPLIKPSIKARMGVYAAVKFFRFRVPPMALVRSGRLRWTYLDKNPLNSLHRDMNLFVALLDAIRDQLEARGRQ